MMSEKEMAKVYETLLTVPGMNEQVKIDLRLPRKTILLVVQIIESGLQTNIGDNQFAWSKTMTKEQKDELGLVVGDCLQKSGLTELSEKLKSLLI